MFASALGDLSGRLDSEFLTAYLMPASVAVFGACSIALVHLGVDRTMDRLHSLDSFEQGILLLIAVAVALLLALMLRALTLPVFELFAGHALPSQLAKPMIRRQAAESRRAAAKLSASATDDRLSHAALHRAHVNASRFPRDEADVGPTRLANVLHAAQDHPLHAYRMAGALWLPRLVPLLPDAFRTALIDAFAPVIGFLYLTIVLFTLGAAGGVVFGFLDHRWTLAAATLAAGLLLARMCYLAAVSQAAELAGLARVAFDLYRNSILTQLGIERPADHDAERALWEHLTLQLTPFAADLSGASRQP